MGIIFNAFALLVSIVLLLVSFKVIKPWKHGEGEEWLRKNGTMAKVGGVLLFLISVIKVFAWVYGK
jgi:hypothetical protein